MNKLKDFFFKKSRRVNASRNARSTPRTYTVADEGAGSSSVGDIVLSKDASSTSSCDQDLTSLLGML